MSDLTPSGGHTPRRVRERRAFQLVTAGGTAGAVAVIGFLLAIFGVVGFAIPLLAAVVAVVCGLLFRRNVARG